MNLFSEGFVIVAWAGWIAWNIKADYENKQTLKEIHKDIKRLIK